MFPIIEKQSHINEFKYVAIPSARKLYNSYGPFLRDIKFNDEIPVDVTAGMNKLNDIRQAEEVDFYSSYSESQNNSESSE